MVDSTILYTADKFTIWTGSEAINSSQFDDMVIEEHISQKTNKPYLTYRIKMKNGEYLHGFLNTPKKESSLKYMGTPMKDTQSDYTLAVFENTNSKGTYLQIQIEYNKDKHKAFMSEYTQ